MGYLHIDNLYKPEAQDILLFKECYAMEKIHGTSAHVKYSDGRLHFFSGGVQHESFVRLFDYDNLLSKFIELGVDNVIVYGEAYGGSCQKMSDVYGKDLKFIAFDVMIYDNWLDVPNANDVCNKLGIEFVDYVKIPTTLEAIDAERDKPSVQAVRNGVGNDKWREGVILRPLVELSKKNGKRLICKHKRPEFRETKTERVVSAEQLQVLSDAKAIAEEWVTPMRLEHVLDKLDGPKDMTIMPKLMSAMKDDIKREAEGEIVWSNEVAQAIGKHTAVIMKEYLKASLK